MKKTRLIATVAGVAAFVAMSAGALADSHRSNGRGTGPVIFVLAQGLYYDSIVLTDVPMHGKFQSLHPVAPGLLETEFGPGDVGYLGGRWWLDVSGDGVMGEGDKFFLCPLLGPGRSTP